MAQYDVVAARTSAFADLLSALKPLLEPSEAEKQANALTSDLRRAQMMQQLDMDFQDKKKAALTLEEDQFLAQGLEGLDASFAGDAQHAYGFKKWGDWTDGVNVIGTQPGETIRHIANLNRSVKGSHDKLWNPVTAVMFAYGGWRFGGSAIAQGQSLRTWQASLGTIVTGINTGHGRRAATKKGADLIAKQIAKYDATAAAKFSQGVKAFQVATGGAAAGGIAQIGSYTTGLPSVFDKNPHAKGRNSYWKPKVMGDIHSKVQEYKLLQQKVRFNAKQGSKYQLAETQQALKNSMIQTLNTLEPTAGKKEFKQRHTNRPGDYLHHELYNNYKPFEVIEYGDGAGGSTEITIKQARDYYQSDIIFLKAALREIESFEK
jgi:hypothetical protein